MNPKKKYKNNLFLLLILLVVIVIGVGYAILSETLKIDGIIGYDNMSWDVGFSSVTDNGGSILSTSSITNEGKTIKVNCDLGTSTDKESCIVKATITNNGNFDIGLTGKPIINYDDTYVHTVTFKWADHEVFGNTTVLQNGFIAARTSEEVILTIKTKFLKEDNLPTSGINIPISVTLNFTEWQNGALPTKSDLAILKATSETDTTAFRSETYKEKIKTITFEDKINAPANYIESWDIGVNANTVKAYVTPNQDDSSYYDLYIQSNTQLYANEDMSYWFADLKYVDVINNLDLLDTSMTTNMVYMFYRIGYNSMSVSINLTKFDTSKVSNMGCMFYGTGYRSSIVNVDISSFDTSAVKSMRFMLNGIGHNSSSFTLDVSNFDTSNAIDMYAMFYGVGAFNHNFVLDVSNFDTSKVTNMGYMFYKTGYSSNSFILDISNFDMSHVIDMQFMFYCVGYSSTKLNTSITIRNPNTNLYENMFLGVATQPGSQIVVNYTKETEELVDAMIATKSSDSNVVKGVLVS